MMTSRETPLYAEPPYLHTEAGDVRCVGVEIEFAGLPPARAADMVTAVFDGRTEQESPHRYWVRGAGPGDFEIELDYHVVHGEAGGAAAGDESFLGQLGAFTSDMERRVREGIGDVSKAFMPYEVITPPLPLSILPRCDDLLEGLRRAGARGTADRVVYGFGLHLNPEVAAERVDYVTSVLKAFVLMEDWLRKEIELNLTRRVLPFSAAFGVDYVAHIADPAYAPDLDGLIDDYLTHNLTRNRSLDMLPLFEHLRPGSVRARLDDDRIKARPTFHYRLPDSRVDDPAWSIAEEWNRWVLVERLANDPEKLAAAGRHYRQLAGDERLDRWVTDIDTWIEA